MEVEDGKKEAATAAAWVPAAAAASCSLYSNGTLLGTVSGK